MDPIEEIDMQIYDLQGIKEELQKELKDVIEEICKLKNQRKYYLDEAGYESEEKEEIPF